MIAELKGDTREQAELRDRAIQEWEVVSVGENPGPRFLTLVTDELRPDSWLLDIGCGTGHLLAEILAASAIKPPAIGIDASEYMLAIASRVQGVHLIRADEAHLPLSRGSINVVVSRLADYTPAEVSAVLVHGGTFLEYGLGPRDSEEIALAFGNRYCCEYSQDDPAAWFAAREIELAAAGLRTELFEVFNTVDFLTRTQLEESIAMVPLVEDFSPQRDASIIEAMATCVHADGTLRWIVQRQTTLRRARKVQ